MPARHSRLWRWGLIIAALAALFLLAVGLSAPAMPATWAPETLWGEHPGGGQTENMQWLGRLLVTGGLILLLTLVVANVLLASRHQRRLPATNFSLITVVLMLLIIAVLRPEVLERLQISPPPAVSSSGTQTPGAATPPVPAALPAALLYAVSLAMAILLVGLLWAVWRRLRRRASQTPAPVAQQAARLAQAALAGWQSGSPLAHVIVRCYREMSELVAEKRAVQRPADMTPREFVQRLEKAGVPAEPIEQLTALFELARYSTRPMGAPEEAAARACLKALAEALEAPA